ncbi:MAG: 4-hydroxythreonine-4-phosphate dehydrogenase PdxA [Endomicrobia bacterium]|nr:4-hydroxythreonine-4-phosphate dehydrogenase PdxA [Endomicrobiia bacterium]
MRNWLLISCGEVDGIGYELVLKLLQRYNHILLSKGILPIVFGNLSWLNFISKKCKINNFYPLVIDKEFFLSIKTLSLARDSFLLIDVYRCHNLSKIKKESGKISHYTLEKLVELANCFMSENFNFEVLTMPVNKKNISKYCLDFSGHTEYFAKKFSINSNKVSMLMEGKDNQENTYRVLLLTRHVPLSQVSKNLNIDYIVEQITNVVNFIFQYESCKLEEVVMCNLNPHGGDGGEIGKEEITVISKSVKILRKKLRVNIKFPLQISDTFNYVKNTKKNILIVANYHDQAMIPLKLICGYRIINITVGLPFLRLSPGHGTASDIATKCSSDVSAAFMCLEKIINFNKVI